MNLYKFNILHLIFSFLYIVDDIYLGNFINYYSSGSTSDTGPNVDSFVWHALEDIKANVYSHLIPGD